MKFYAKEILLEDGWASNKTLTISDGMITTIEDGKAADAEHFSGPVIPGMVNLHSHAFQKAFVGLTEFQADKEDSFWSWRDSMYQLLQRLTLDDMHTVATYLYQEMLLNGYTSCAEFHYLHREATSPDSDSFDASNAVIQGALKAGIALCHCPVFYSYSGFGEQPPNPGQQPFLHTVEAFQSLMERLKQQYTRDSLISFGIAPHSLRAVSASQLKRLTDWWPGPVHIHISEQIKEVNECVEFYGKRPVQWLIDNFPLSDQWCLVHATHLDEQEVRALAKSQAIAGICPETEANLGDGIFPAAEFIAQGGQFGIGSDSHITISPWRELKLFEYTQRLTQQKRNRLCDDDNPHVGSFLWQTAARNGAKVIDRKAGVLKPGHCADLVVLNSDIAELSALNGDYLLDAAVFAVNENPVRDVMVNGEWRVQWGRLSGNSAKSDYLKFLQQKIRR